MNAPTRAFPVWLRVLCYTLGALLIVACLWAFFITGVAFWLLLHSKQGLWLKNGTVFAEVLGRFTGEVLVLCLGIWLVRRPGKSKWQVAKIQAGAAEAP